MQPAELEPHLATEADDKVISDPESTPSIRIFDAEVPTADRAHPTPVIVSDVVPPDR